MNKTTLNSQKEKHSMLSLRRAMSNSKVLVAVIELFLSTLSLRRATSRHNFGLQNRKISIHALLAESDLCQLVHNDAAVHFYPRSPCGERPAGKCVCPGSAVISIHALLAESDSSMILMLRFFGYFYPRSPCGERLWPGLLARPFFIISIHALLAESDEHLLII